MLKLSALPLPNDVLRDVRQELVPVEQGLLRRSLDGVLHHLAACYPAEAAGKYRSVISGRGGSVPAFETLFCGLETEVECLVYLSAILPAQDSEITLARDPVAGSIHALQPDGTPVEIASVDGRVVTLAPQDEAVILRYRPRLVMLVEDWQGAEAQWQEETRWSLTLIET